MPVYEYTCPRGHRFERVVQVSKDEPKESVHCQKKCPHVATLVPSQTGKFILKAGKVGGFYASTKP